MICTTYQTNSFKIIKSTFNTYELPHAPVIFLSISVYSIVLKFRQSLKFPTKCANLRKAVAPPPPAPEYFGTLVKATCEVHLQVPTQYTKYGNVIEKVQNKFGNRALKNDLKLTLIIGCVYSYTHVLADEFLKI